jgi:hypothetical protein
MKSGGWTHPKDGSGDESEDEEKNQSLNDSPPLTVSEGRRKNFDLR